MDTAIDALSTLREMSDVELSRRSGVSRSTLHRIEKGSASPTLKTLRELAIAAGVDIDVSIKPLSDPYASRGARFLLDSQFSMVPVTRFDREWMERLSRVSDADPISLVLQAGHASSLLHRADTISVAASFPALRLASAGDASGGEWALSGGVAINLLRNRTDGDTPGPDVLYVDDPHHAWRLLESPSTAKKPGNVGLVIAPWREEYGVDFWEHGPVRLVAPIQILLDAVGLGAELRDVALDIAGGW